MSSPSEFVRIYPSYTLNELNDYDSKTIEGLQKLFSQKIKIKVSIELFG